MVRHLASWTEHAREERVISRECPQAHCHEPRGATVLKVEFWGVFFFLVCVKSSSYYKARHTRQCERFKRVRDKVVGRYVDLLGLSRHKVNRENW